MSEAIVNMELVHESLFSKYSRFLTRDEAYEIIRHFELLPLQPGRQVMWSGVPRSWVQTWADDREMQTLTTAMGPLMHGPSPLCKRSSKTPEEWSKYVAGASALFAESLPKENVVTLITRPPPQRLHPLESTTYQMLEQPALKMDVRGQAVSHINVVHITVTGAENSAYQFWPVDEGHQWAQHHNSKNVRKRFTATKTTKPQAPLQKSHVGGPSSARISGKDQPSLHFSYDALLAICLMSSLRIEQKWRIEEKRKGEAMARGAGKTGKTRRTEETKGTRKAKKKLLKTRNSEEKKLSTRQKRNVDSKAKGNKENISQNKGTNKRRKEQKKEQEKQRNDQNNKKEKIEVKKEKSKEDKKKQKGGVPK